MTTFPDIADYAFLSDCEVNALIAPSGAVEWMCIPRMDGPSVFGSRWGAEWRRMSAKLEVP